MTSLQTKQFEDTKSFVKDQLHDAEGGHDWFHIQRVLANCKLILQTEKADVFTVYLGALLHDIADSKFYNGDETIGPKRAKDFLTKINVDKSVINHCVQIISHISFKGGNQIQTFTSAELAIIQDADRLDAIGAIGIARAFNYGGYKNRTLYDPDCPPNLNLTKEQYKISTAPTINHFYEKLLRLKALMTTKTAQQIAEGRHQFMLDYLNQFYAEWNGAR